MLQKARSILIGQPVACCDVKKASTECKWYRCCCSDVRQALTECKWRHLRRGLISILLWKVRFCCALTIQYSIYSTVGRSIASIYDLGAHIYLGASCLSKYVSASVVYIGYILHIIAYTDQSIPLMNTCTHLLNIWHECTVCIHVYMYNITHIRTHHIYIHAHTHTHTMPSFTTYLREL